MAQFLKKGYWIWLEIAILFCLAPFALFTFTKPFVFHICALGILFVLILAFAIYHIINYQAAKSKGTDVLNAKKSILFALIFLIIVGFFFGMSWSLWYKIRNCDNLIEPFPIYPEVTQTGVLGTNEISLSADKHSILEFGAKNYYDQNVIFKITHDCGSILSTNGVQYDPSKHFTIKTIPEFKVKPGDTEVSVILLRAEPNLRKDVFVCKIIADIYDEHESKLEQVSEIVYVRIEP